jgi:hypothetical protein
MQTGLQLGPDGRPIARVLLDAAYAASMLSAEEFTRACAEVEEAINSASISMPRYGSTSADESRDKLHIDH